MNEAVIGMLGAASNSVVSLVFQEKDDGTKKKGAALMTISAAHRCASDLVSVCESVCVSVLPSVESASVPIL